MSPARPTLHLVCGKIAAGKSTLARQLSEAEGTVLIAEDDWLSALFSDRMETVSDYVQCAAKLRGIMGPHILGLLEAGVSVVLDFPANTVETRRWMRGLLDKTYAGHILHVLEPSDEVCMERLAARNAKGNHPFAVTEDQFHQISRHYVSPSPDEGFAIRRYDAEG